MLGVVLDLATQARDLHVHRALLALSPIAAQFLDQLRAAQRLPGFAGKDLHQLDFGRGQPHQIIAAPHLAAFCVIAQATKAQIFWRAVISHNLGHTAQDRIDPQKQFLGLKRFGQIIIGPRLQPCDPVVSFCARR